MQGLYLPLITAFRDGELDEHSTRRMLRHYANQPIDGLILAATTGEGMTLTANETHRLVTLAAEEMAGRKTILLGLTGSDTAKLTEDLRRVNDWPIDGYLIACPYYTRPSQLGLYGHFKALAAATDRPILIYNIPYRTGVNLGNETMLRLAEVPNIAGVKDCCADAVQSFDLIRARPPGFAVLTGEDAWFYTAMTLGGDGGILASAHIDTASFRNVYDLIQGNDMAAALAVWRKLVELPRLLFTEPSPGPIKHYLWRLGLIDSPETRAPMTGISAPLAERIDAMTGVLARTPSGGPDSPWAS